VDLVVTSITQVWPIARSVLAWLSKQKLISGSSVVPEDNRNLQTQTHQHINMSWKACFVAALLAPLVVGGVYMGLGGTNLIMIIGRSYALVVIPATTTGVLMLAGGCYTSRNCHNGCHKFEEASLGFLFGGTAGLFLGGVIDVVLLYKWLH
jgi:hypothetical protein